MAIMPRVTPRAVQNQGFVKASHRMHSFSAYRDVPNLKGPGTRAVEAWFLGPKAENAEEFERLLLEAVRDHVFWRRNFHPGDPTHITEHKAVLEALEEIAPKHTRGY